MGVNAQELCKGKRSLDLGANVISGQERGRENWVKGSHTDMQSTWDSTNPKLAVRETSCLPGALVSPSVPTLHRNSPWKAGPQSPDSSIPSLWFYEKGKARVFGFQI